MQHYSSTAVERAMKVHEVIMRAMSGEIAWFQAAEIIGISCRQMQRWKRRWENHGYEGLLDRRRGQPSPKRIAVPVLQEVLRLYREQYLAMDHTLWAAMTPLVRLYKLRSDPEPKSNYHQAQSKNGWLCK